MHIQGPILVTGGTGELGRPTAQRLRARGHEVRILSRRPGPGRVVGDLDRGTGIREAVAGADTVIHLASNRRADLAGTRRLLDASRAAGVRHVVYISIVGVDRIPYFYYRDKVANEAAIAASGIPHTILRATQFHAFPIQFFQLQRRLPVLLGLDTPFQPIAAHEVADRLVELAEEAPAGRVPDIGGPEILNLLDAARLWQETQPRRKRVWRVPLRGRTIRAFRAGHHMTGLPGYGRQTFAEHLASD